MLLNWSPDTPKQPETKAATKTTPNSWLVKIKRIPDMETEAKIDKILDTVQEIKIEQAKVAMQLSQHRSEISMIKKITDNHEQNKNKILGIFMLLGLAASAFFTWLFKHL